MTYILIDIAIILLLEVVIGILLLCNFYLLRKILKFIDLRTYTTNNMIEDLGKSVILQKVQIKEMIDRLTKYIATIHRNKKEQAKNSLSKLKRYNSISKCEVTS